MISISAILDVFITLNILIYYQPVAELADKAMRPSGTLNAILNAIGA